MVLWCGVYIMATKNSAKFVCVESANTKEMRDAKSAFANELGSRCGVLTIIRTFQDKARGMFEPFLAEYGYEWKDLCGESGKLVKDKFNKAMLSLWNDLAPEMYTLVQDENAEQGVMRTAIVNWRRVSTGEVYSFAKKNGEVVEREVKVWDDTAVYNESRWTVNKLYRVLQFSETWKKNHALGNEVVNTIEDESAPEQTETAPTSASSEVA